MRSYGTTTQYLAYSAHTPGVSKLEFCVKQDRREMATTRSGLVETIRYINDPSNCLYGRFAMMVVPARVFGPIVADNFGPSAGSIGTLDFSGRNS